MKSDVKTLRNRFSKFGFSLRHFSQSERSNNGDGAGRRPAADRESSNADIWPATGRTVSGAWVYESAASALLPVRPAANAVGPAAERLQRAGLPRLRQLRRTAPRRGSHRVRSTPQTEPRSRSPRQSAPLLATSPGSSHIISCAGVGGRWRRSASRAVR